MTDFSDLELEDGVRARRGEVVLGGFFCPPADAFLDELDCLTCRGNGGLLEVVDVHA